MYNNKAAADTISDIGIDNVQGKDFYRGSCHKAGHTALQTTINLNRYCSQTRRLSNLEEAVVGRYIAMPPNRSPLRATRELIASGIWIYEDEVASLIVFQTKAINVVLRLSLRS